MSGIIYHGSDHVIQNPKYGFGKKYNDYGLGFYCTAISEMANEWAVDRDRDGYNNAYMLEIEKMSCLNLNDGDHSIFEWLALLLANRNPELYYPLQIDARKYIIDNFLPDISSYDVIIGYRADDSYFTFVRDFLSGTISFQQLKQAMYLGKLGEQVVLKSEKAFSEIRYMGSTIASHKDWYYKKQQRDNQARQEYVSLKFQSGDIYIQDILREEMKEDDLRLQ